jgi:acyl-CoA synthetase (NDP forming)
MLLRELDVRRGADPHDREPACERGQALLRDLAVALAPVTPEDAEKLIRSLRAAPLLEGARGRAPLDIAAAARTAAALASVAASRPELQEIEINPLLVMPTGARGLDARLVLANTS